MAVQSESQICPIDSNGICSPVTRCASLADGGSLSIGRRPLDFPRILFVLAIVMVTPIGVRISSFSGIDSSTRCKVHALSAARNEVVVVLDAWTVILSSSVSSVKRE